MKFYNYLCISLMLFGLMMMLALPDSSMSASSNSNILIQGALLFLVALLSFLVPILWKNKSPEEN